MQTRQAVSTRAPAGNKKVQTRGAIGTRARAVSARAPAASPSRPPIRFRPRARESRTGPARRLLDRATAGQLPGAARPAARSDNLDCAQRRKASLVCVKLRLLSRTQTHPPRRDGTPPGPQPAATRAAVRMGRQPAGPSACAGATRHREIHTDYPGPRGSQISTSNMWAREGERHLPRISGAARERDKKIPARSGKRGRKEKQCGHLIRPPGQFQPPG